MGYVYVTIIVALLLKITGHYKAAFIFVVVAITLRSLQSLYAIIKFKLKEKRDERKV